MLTTNSINWKGKCQHTWKYVRLSNISHALREALVSWKNEHIVFGWHFPSSKCPNSWSTKVWSWWIRASTISRPRMVCLTPLAQLALSWVKDSSTVTPQSDFWSILRGVLWHRQHKQRTTCECHLPTTIQQPRWLLLHEPRNWSQNSRFQIHRSVPVRPCHWSGSHFCWRRGYRWSWRRLMSHFWMGDNATRR